MDSSHGGDDKSNSKKRRIYHRHTQQQTQQLEAFFKEYPHPKDAQRMQLSKDLGLTPQQIKFWFQNKRTQIKTMNERSDNDALRSENERFRRENMSMLEALKNVTCHACPQGSSSTYQPQTLLALRMENLRLRKELQHHELTERLQEHEKATPGYCFPEQNLEISESSSAYPSRMLLETDRSMIIETAVSAMNELIELLHVNDPMWTISPSDGTTTIHRETYDKLFPKPTHFKSTSARIESSKDSGEVAMGGAQLVQVFRDPIKWMEMFPTIVTKAKAFEVVDTTATFRSGSVHLMYEKMHILSPLVAPREFFFIRYIQHIAPTAWMVVDVSYDFIKQLQDSSAPYRAWKLPSGCMIQDQSKGKSLVTWIEHVEVDDKSCTHRLYRDVACHAYGAKRWIATLQRMCDRLACSLGLAITPTHDLEGVIKSGEGRKNLMRLSHRMVKSLCQILNMSDRPHLSELNNNGVQVSVRISNGRGQPKGLIVTAATSLSLPLSLHHLSHFFNDETQRHQWDILSGKDPVSAIARISTGTDPGNCISIIQPKENLLMLQESSIDSVGASLVYAPVDLASITSVVDGADESRVEILPSGYLISEEVEGRGRGRGSILTIALQILACHTSKSQPPNMESVAIVHSLISSTAHRIKAALGCPHLD